MKISQLTRININLLVTLQVLLQHRNASSSAVRLNLSQSTIRKKNYHSLGITLQIFADLLFHRVSHGLMPTPLA